MHYKYRVGYKKIKIKTHLDPWMNCLAYKQTYRHSTVLRQWSDKGRPYWLRLCSDSLSQPAVTPSLCSSDALKRQRSIQASPLPPAAAYSLTWGFLCCLFFHFGSMKQIWTLINIILCAVKGTWKGVACKVAEIKTSRFFKCAWCLSVSHNGLV